MTAPTDAASALPRSRSRGMLTFHIAAVERDPSGLIRAHLEGPGGLRSKLDFPGIPDSQTRSTDHEGHRLAVYIRLDSDGQVAACGTWAAGPHGPRREDLEVGEALAMCASGVHGTIRMVVIQSCSTRACLLSSGLGG